MKKRVFASLLVVILAFSLLGATAFAQTDVDLSRQDGKLVITEPGSYVLQGKLTGCVYVDPGQGEAELILGGVDINGASGAGIVAVSGDKPTLTLPEGSVVNFYGGDISIVSGDDAINAANSDGLYAGVLDYSFNMMGGQQPDMGDMGSMPGQQPGQGQGPGMGGRMPGGNPSELP